MTKDQAAAPSDGRRLRSERTRQAILDAALALLEEGHLVPTAQLIAERADVGIRSFFRHFGDMESLFTAVDNEIRQTAVSRFVGGDREGSLSHRILHAAQRHAEGYELEQNHILSTSAQSWRYAVLRKNYAGYQRGLRRDLEDWLPEIKNLPAARREAIDAIASFEMWHRLRSHQGLSKRTAIEVIAELLEEIIPHS